MGGVTTLAGSSSARVNSQLVPWVRQGNYSRVRCRLADLVAFRAALRRQRFRRKHQPPALAWQAALALAWRRQAAMGLPGR
jgi:hypothetical protein